jgi:hypothetical protein
LDDSQAMSRVTTTVGVGRGVGVAAALVGLAVVTAGDDGDAEAPAAQPPSRKVTVRPTTSRTAARRAFIPVLLWDARGPPWTVTRCDRGGHERWPAPHRIGAATDRDGQ